MEKRKNCWEVMDCGRGPDGNNINDLGTCPVTEQTEFNGVNMGTAAGRFCWTVEGTLCSGTFDLKFGKCLDCRFYKEVEQQEGSSFILTKRQFYERRL